MVELRHGGIDRLPTHHETRRPGDGGDRPAQLRIAAALRQGLHLGGDGIAAIRTARAAADREVAAFGQRVPLRGAERRSVHVHALHDGAATRQQMHGAADLQLRRRGGREQRHCRCLPARGQGRGPGHDGDDRRAGRERGRGRRCADIERPARQQQRPAGTRLQSAREPGRQRADSGQLLDAGRAHEFARAIAGLQHAVDLHRIARAHVGETAVARQHGDRPARGIVVDDDGLAPHGEAPGTGGDIGDAAHQLRGDLHVHRRRARIEGDIGVLADLQVRQPQRHHIDEIGPALQHGLAVVESGAVHDHAAESGHGAGHDAGAASADAAAVTAGDEADSSSRTASAAGQQQESERAEQQAMQGLHGFGSSGSVGLGSQGADQK